MTVVHIGHAFYGAGNIGDDLMLAGFLACVESRADLVFTCCTSHDIESQRRRFPRIEWLPYTSEQRRAAIANADVWLGLGGSPFQSDDGDWFTHHLIEEMALCAEREVPMDFLGVGVNDADALRDVRLRHVLARARVLLTRDARSARLLRPCAPAVAGADLAHVFLEDWARDRANAHEGDAHEGRIGFCLNFHEDLSPLVAPFEALLERCPQPEAVGLVGEVRVLPQGERALYGLLSSERASRLRVCVPDYAAPTCEALLAAWPRCGFALSSRYHAALVQAWSGACVGVLGINDKLRGAAEELGVPLFERLDDVDLSCLVAAVSPERLLARAVVARQMVARWLEAVDGGGMRAVPRQGVPQRVVVICPDALGDLVLRQPLLTALVEKGHAVTVAARSHVAALTSYIDPRLDVLTIPVNPYHIVQPLEHAQALAELVADLEACDFEVVMFPAYTRTVVDEAVARGLPWVRRVGFSGAGALPFTNQELETLLSALPETVDVARLTVEVPVSQAWPETRKYAALAELGFDAPVAQPRPRLTLPKETTALARQVLADLGLTSKRYAAVFPLGTANVSLKAVPRGVTVTVTTALARDVGLEVLLMGEEAERAELEVLRDTLGSTGVAARVWVGGVQDLGTLLGLLAEARLYFGADTGPMHMAAALGVPVAAVFGGGTWPRFVPQAEHACVVVRPIECFGCGWSCPYPRPRCLDELDPAQVADDVRRFCAGLPAG
ncbi:MAG: hypothetical protein EB084_12705 [Proteobacteria bacterium]|nr:hypothetical protein [Pseudomonadota bacterium]